MNKILSIIALTGLLVIGSVPANAGCLTGALVGGIAGHFVGHHGLAGAAAGCAGGLYLNHRRDQQRQRQEEYNNRGYMPSNPSNLNLDQNYNIKR